MNTVKENELLENKELREELIEKVEVLGKVKELLLLPNTEYATTKQVAEYFEVNPSIIRKLIERNDDEIKGSGMVFKKYAEALELLGNDADNLRSDIVSRLGINKRGVNIFSKRAILNVAMLLRDSEIAKQVRQSLLDQQEVIIDEQKVKGINDKEQLLLSIITAESDFDRAIAMNEYENYNRRHIAKLNVDIERMKPKEESFDKFIAAGNYQRMGNVAKTLGVGRNKLFQFLRDNKVLMSDNTPYQSYIDREWFVVKQNTVINDNFSKNVTQTFATSKGVDGISKMMEKNALTV